MLLLLQLLLLLCLSLAPFCVWLSGPWAFISPLQICITSEVASKRKFCDFVSIECLGETSSHAFCDMGDASKEVAHCENHDEDCFVPGASMISFVGWSCKNFSKEFSSNGDGLLRTAFLDGGGFEAGEGTSGETFSKLRSILRYKKHAIVIFENVPEALQDKSLLYIRTAIEGEGYALAALGLAGACMSPCCLKCVLQIYGVEVLEHVVLCWSSTIGHSVVCIFCMLGIVMSFVLRLLCRRSCNSLFP
jgi:hypothetical protein